MHIYMNYYLELNLLYKHMVHGGYDTAKKLGYCNT